LILGAVIFSPRHHAARPAPLLARAIIDASQPTRTGGAFSAKPLGVLRLAAAFSIPTKLTCVAGGSRAAASCGNRIRGLTIGSTGAGTGIKGNFGTLVVRETTINGTGEAIDLSNGDLDAIFDNVSSISGVTAVNLDTVTGSFQALAGSISGSTGTAFNVSGGTLTVTYDKEDIRLVVVNLLPE